MRRRRRMRSLPECPYLPVVVRTMMAAAMQVKDASTAAMAMVCVESV